MFRALVNAGTILTALLLGIGVMMGITIMLFVAASRRRSARGAQIASPIAASDGSDGEDVLAAAEEAAMVASVTRTMQARAQTEEMAQKAMHWKTVQWKEEEPTALDAEIDWQERDDVYRPETVDAVAFVQSFGFERPPEIVPQQNQIFIRQSAYARLREHLRQDLSVELGGLLYGQAFYDAARELYLLVIEAALAAADGIESAISFTYTPASWEALAPQLQQLDSAWTLIGSYHSHPGLGVFLSGTDLGTQETFFAEDWQIALVVDPIADTLGFFTGKDGAPCPHWRILPDRG